MTNGQKLAAKADQMGLPERTLDQVKEALEDARRTGAEASMARLMLRHGRLTPEARAYLAGL